MAGEFVSLKGRSWAAIILLGLSALIALLEIGANLVLLSEVDSGEPLGEFTVGLALVGVVAILHVLCFIACAIAFIVWMHRAYANLDAFGATGRAYSRGWTIGAWFIPFANLWLPYKVMQEIWQLSEPAGDETPMVAPIGAWWGAYVAMSILSNVAARLDDLGASAVTAIITAIISVVAALLAIRLVHLLTARQERAPRASAGTAEVFA